MPTRCWIGQKRDDGIHSFYCHHDGYPEYPHGVASKLVRFYDSEDLATKLIDLCEPIAAALAQIDGITMYGSGNEAKLVEEIQQHGDQIFQGLNKTLGIDLKSVLLGYLGPKALKAITPKEEK